MDEIYLTNQVAKILDISVATVRNYAIALERAGYEFKKKKQARLWTSTEIELVQEIQRFYQKSDYTLEQAFDYIVKVHNEGEEAGNKLLQTFQTSNQHRSPNTPDSDHLAGIQGDTKAIISMLSDIQANVVSKDMLIEMQEDSEEVINLKQDKENLSKENADLLKELEELRKEKEQTEKQIEKLKEMSTFEFWKFKKE